MRSQLLALASGTALALLPVPPAHAGTTDNAANGDSNNDFLAWSTPPGFDDLAQPREVLVDVYFGGKKVGSAVALARPAFLRFRDPAAVAALVPNLAALPELIDALSGDLPTHASLICALSNASDCGKLPTGSAGIIFDESHFRVDLFVPPSMLGEIGAAQKKFLDSPGGGLSFNDIVGFTLAGSHDQSPAYNIENRAIVALDRGRVRINTSYASKIGLLVDDLVGEYDSNTLRYSAGLFWAPGLDLTGRRRIAGVGIGTQFDTRADRDSVGATPLLVFLSSPARVEFLIDGRLVGSRSYDAGNNILDTSGLPEGSYPLVLRITEANGSVREERRFFVKTPQVAPIGQPLYFAYVGMLANARADRAISVSNQLYYQAGTARRLSPAFAVDLSVVGTQRKAMVEAGGWLLTPFVRIRAAGLVSSKGDSAVLLQGTSNGRSRFNFSFDLRRVWSHDDRPLIPLPSFVESFGPDQPTGAQIGGSYLQASGTVGYSLGRAYLSVIGSLRKDAHHKSDYSVGPGITWPIFSRNGLQVTFQADAQWTRDTTAAFAGFRLLYTGNHLSATGTGGFASQDNRGEPSRQRAIGGISTNYLYEDDDRTQLSAGGGVERAVEGTIAHAGGTLYSRFGSVRADVLDNLEGNGGVQYGLTVQSAVAVGGGELGLGTRDLEGSAAIIEVASATSDASFTLLVNGSPQGHVRSGGSLPIHLQPYRAYEMRLIPDAAASIALDADSKTVTLYPGTVRVVRWSAHTYFTAFGQAVGPDGSPVANALVEAPHSVGETDDNGYFQIDAAEGETVSFTRGSSRCLVKLDGSAPRKELVSLGKVVCR